jgi:hypothetical protein
MNRTQAIERSLQLHPQGSMSLADRFRHVDELVSDGGCPADEVREQVLRSLLLVTL